MVKFILLIVLFTICLFSSDAVRRKTKKPEGQTLQNPDNEPSGNIVDIPFESLCLNSHFHGNVSEDGNAVESASTSDSAGVDEEESTGRDHPLPFATMKHLLDENEMKTYSCVGKSFTMNLLEQDVYPYAVAIGNGFTTEAVKRWISTLPRQTLPTPNYDMVLHDFHLKENDSMLSYGVTKNSDGVNLMMNERLILCAGVVAVPKDPNTEPSRGLACLRIYPGFTLGLSVTFTPVKKGMKGPPNYRGSDIPIGFRFVAVLLPPITEEEDRVPIGFRMGTLFRTFNDLTMKEAMVEPNQKFGNRQGAIKVKISTEILTTKWTSMDEDEQREYERLARYETNFY